jgi:membrane protein YqaA with SNARE-associated domain
MALTITLTPRTQYRRIAVLVVAAALVTAGLLLWLVPESSALVGYALYAIPAHLLISVFLNEPMLWATAKVSPPALVAIAGTIGCLVAIAIDYAIIGWLVNRRFIKTEIEDSPSFQRATRFFGRAPFLFITASALLPVPFYPVKILAIVSDYPIVRFAAALVIGRLPRFYLLAVTLKQAPAPQGALLSATAGIALIAGWLLWRTWQRNRRANPGETT